MNFVDFDGFVGVGLAFLEVVMVIAPRTLTAANASTDTEPRGTCVHVACPNLPAFFFSQLGRLAAVLVGRTAGGRRRRRGLLQ